MKKIHARWLLLCTLALRLAGFGFAADTVSADSTIERALKNTGIVSSVSPREPGRYAEKWEVTIEQNLNHKKIADGSFEQRFILCHRDSKLPVVFVTEGYRADYALRPGYSNEIAEYLGANVVVVEHRYFSRSTPDPRNWEYLNVENSMDDLHAVRELLRPIYPGPWITTGISKGGMTTLMYKTWYPEDADISVAYVAPMCTAVEDPRFIPFLTNVGTQEQRDKILNFQREVLSRREEIQPLFDRFAEEKGLAYPMRNEQALDYTVLEYAFSFWQWGANTDTIPLTGESPERLFDHLKSVIRPAYFAVSDEPSFYVQASRELGFYGYDIRRLRDVLTIRTAKGYLNRYKIPEDAQGKGFSRHVSQRVNRYLRKNDPRLICIYGEYDPWTGGGLDPSLFSGKKNMKMAVEPGGSHRARIATLPEAEREEIWRTIEQWLQEQEDPDRP